MDLSTSRARRTGTRGREQNCAGTSHNYAAAKICNKARSRDSYVEEEEGRRRGGGGIMERAGFLSEKA